MAEQVKVRTIGEADILFYLRNEAVQIGERLGVRGGVVAREIVQALILRALHPAREIDRQEARRLADWLGELYAE